MNAKSPNRQLFSLLRESVNSCVVNPVILFPFATIAFIQLLVIEIIYFSPRFPLVRFFGPVIRRLEGEIYLHYPHSFMILPKWFQIAQYFIYIFIGSFLTAVAIAIIANLNSSKKTNLSSAARETLPQYVHIALAAIITFAVFYGLTGILGLIVRRAVQIQSQTGIFYVIKAIVLYGLPYYNLLIGVLVTTVFAFVFPAIVIDRKKIVPALLINFRYLWKSFWFLFVVILIPTLFYVPVLLLRNNFGSSMDMTFQELKLALMVLSVLVMLFIDAAIYTALATYYLMKKEAQ